VSVSLDFFTGIGIAHVDSEYTNRIITDDKTPDPFFEGENYTSGKRNLYQFSTGVHLEYFYGLAKTSNLIFIRSGAASALSPS
jgi:hypothetical protein